MKWTKQLWVFVYIKYGKFRSISLRALSWAQTLKLGGVNSFDKYKKNLTGVVPGALIIVVDAILVATVAGLTSHDPEA